MSKEVTIIDYDAGNIFNLFNSLSRLNCKVKVTSNSKEIDNWRRKKERVKIKNENILEVNFIIFWRIKNILNK